MATIHFLRQAADRTVYDIHGRKYSVPTFETVVKKVDDIKKEKPKQFVGVSPKRKHRQHKTELAVAKGKHHIRTIISKFMFGGAEMIKQRVLTRTDDIIVGAARDKKGEVIRKEFIKPRLGITEINHRSKF